MVKRHHQRKAERPVGVIRPSSLSGVIDQLSLKGYEGLLLGDLQPRSASEAEAASA